MDGLADGWVWRDSWTDGRSELMVGLIKCMGSWLDGLIEG